MKLIQALTRSSPTRSMYPYGLDTMTMGGNMYPLGLSTSLSFKQEDIGASYMGFATQAFLANPIVSSLMEYRRKTFNQAYFQWERMRAGAAGPAGEFFGTADLAILEQPATNVTTSDLLSEVIQHADLSGNAFIYRTTDDAGRPMLTTLRPDRVAIIAASLRAPDLGPAAIDATVKGYAYYPNGKGYGDPEILLPEEVAHFRLAPDPTASFRGVSWLTSAIRDIMGDQAATTHKLKYFENGASGAVVVKADPNLIDTLTKFDAWVEKLEQGHKGSLNAYRTWYLHGASEVTTVGANLRQEDFKVTQGAGESRLASAAGVSPVLVGFSEGLQGSSLNSGNYDSARRNYANVTLRDLWGNVSGALQSILPTPGGCRLAVDPRRIALMQADEMDRAEIQKMDASAINTLIIAGFDPDAVVDSIVAGDLFRLKGRHTGMLSVQMQAPGANDEPEDGVPAGRALIAQARQGLIEAGVVRPTVAQLAERVGVSDRTVRRWRG